MFKLHKSKLFLILLTVISSGFLFRVHAGSLFPPFIDQLLNLAGADGSGTGEYAASRIRLFLLLLLGGIVLTAVIYAGAAAIKYIRSQGDQTQIEEATKAIQAIFMGLGALIISILGIVFVFIFFGADLFDTTLYESCLSAPGSLGCSACQSEDGGLPEAWDSLKFASTNPELKVGEDVASGASIGTRSDLSNRNVCTFCEYEYAYKSRRGSFQNPGPVALVCEE